MGDVAEIRGGVGFPLEHQGRAEGEFPFYKVSDMNSRLNWKYMSSANNWVDPETVQVLRARPFPKGTIVFPKIGAAVATNKKRILTRDSLIDNNVMGVIVSDADSCLPEYLYYWFMSVDLVSLSNRGTVPSITASRVKRSAVPVPPVNEQQNLVAMLNLAQEAAAQQSRLALVATEFKQALMHRLFSEGVRGEPQKDSEIGRMPEGWDVVPLGEVLHLAQYGLSVKGDSNGRYPILRMTNQVSGKISPHDLKWIEVGEDEFKKFRVEHGDILFNRTNSFDLVGRTAVFDIEGDYAFASYLIRLRTDDRRLNPFFLNHYFNCASTQLRLKTIATRAVSQSNISATRLKGFPVPIPLPEEQAEIVRTLDVLDSKIALHERERRALESLFRTLLNDLMSARVRVTDLDLGRLGFDVSERGVA